MLAVELEHLEQALLRLLQLVVPLQDLSLSQILLNGILLETVLHFRQGYGHSFCRWEALVAVFRQSPQRDGLQLRRIGKAQTD